MIRWIFRYLSWRSYARLISKGDARGLAMKQARKQGYKYVRRVK